MDARASPAGDHEQEGCQRQQARAEPELAPAAGGQDVDDSHGDHRQDREALEQETAAEDGAEREDAQRRFAEPRQLHGHEQQEEGETSVEIAAAGAVVAEKAKGGREDEAGEYGVPATAALLAEAHRGCDDGQCEERRRQTHREGRAAEEGIRQGDQPVAERRLEVPVLRLPTVGGDEERPALQHLEGRDAVARFVGVVDARRGESKKHIAGHDHEHDGEARAVVSNDKASKSGSRGGVPERGRPLRHLPWRADPERFSHRILRCSLSLTCKSPMSICR